MRVEIEVVRDDAVWDDIDLEGIADRAVRETLARLGLGTGEIAILACDDSRIAALNADFRGKPVATNVLSWPPEERGAPEEGASPAPPQDPELGDVAIARETCEREACAAGIPLSEHVCHLLVHATLHLLGYDHARDGDAALMERLEIEILGKMGLPDPYSRGGHLPPD